MDVFLKVALEDLKYPFSSILNHDFFGKKCTFTFLNDCNFNSPGEKLDEGKILDDHLCIKDYISKNPTKEVIISGILHSLLPSFL